MVKFLSQDDSDDYWPENKLESLIQMKLIDNVKPNKHMFYFNYILT